MSAAHPQLASPGGVTHPAVRRSRLQRHLGTAITAAVPLVLALGVALSQAKPNFALVAAGLVGVIGLMILMVNSRLEFTVTILAVYLGCLDGPVKGFAGGGNVIAVIRNVLIVAVCIGVLARLATKRDQIKLPELSGWVLAYAALVVVEALNPNTIGVLKILGGFRQQLEWIPF